jgi:hypothetical protein
VAASTRTQVRTSSSGSGPGAAGAARPAAEFWSVIRTLYCEDAILDPAVVFDT